MNITKAKLDRMNEILKKNGLDQSPHYQHPARFGAVSELDFDFMLEKLNPTNPLR